MGALHKLHPSRIAGLKAGQHGDGGGLYLRVEKSKVGSAGRVEAGARRWVFIFRFGPPGSDGRAPLQQAGLGGFDSVSLAAAREKASQGREMVKAGVDPRTVWNAKPDTCPTFGEVAADLLTTLKQGWTPARRPDKRDGTTRESPSVQRFVRHTVKIAASLAKKPCNEVDEHDVLEIIKPIWLMKQTTAQKALNDIARVYDAAKALHGRKFTFGPNPALWDGHMEHLLPRPDDLKSKRHPSVAPEAVPEFWSKLARRIGVGADALRWTILTGVRSDNTLDARWCEIDLEARIWHIPVAKVKNWRDMMRREFEYFDVPLSKQALEIAIRARRLCRRPGDPDACVFPGRTMRGGLSTNTMAQTMKRMGYRDDAAAVPHGFRTCIRTWAGQFMETTLSGREVRSYSHEAVEFAIGHVVGSVVSRTYDRGGYLRERTSMMQAWADYVTGESSARVEVKEAA